MINPNEIKITPRDQQVLRLLVQGCSNKEIVRAIFISARGRVKQHLRILFLHAGIKEGYLRAAFDKLGVWTADPPSPGEFHMPSLAN
jgi:DNA-binding NarL/FixJ family response regulator